MLDGLFAHEGTILWAALDHSGRRLATASADHTARIWDVTTGEAITLPLAHDGPVNWVEFQSDGARLLTASDDGTIRIWNAADGQPSGGRWLTHAIAGARWPGSVRTADAIVSGGFDGTVWLWDADTGHAAGLAHAAGLGAVLPGIQPGRAEGRHGRERRQCLGLARH